MHTKMSVVCLILCVFVQLGNVPTFTVRCHQIIFYVFVLWSAQRCYHYNIDCRVVDESVSF